MVHANSKNLIEKFIYSCSHDLRGPVATIQGLVKLAEDHPDQIESNDCMRMIGECSDKLDHLIRSLQQYLANEAHCMAPEIVDPSQLVDEMVSFYEPELLARAITMECLVENGLSSVERFCVSQILKHLIGNAIAFSDPEKLEKRIYVRIRDAPGAFCLVVADNGLGIPKGSRSKVFDIFYRAHNTQVGVGLGLFLVKHLVTKLGGTIQVRSKVKEGTTMTIKLPSLKIA